MDKSPDAFRTISEVAQDLDVPQHVLRFWESKFAQVRPMKRGGGRRYYRPNDVELLRGIRHLLYGEGYTIRGVQKLLRERGVASVAGMAKRSRAGIADTSFRQDVHAGVTSTDTAQAQNIPTGLPTASEGFVRSEPVLVSEPGFAADERALDRDRRTEPHLDVDLQVAPITTPDAGADLLADTDREILRAALADLEDARVFLLDLGEG